MKFDTDTHRIFSSSATMRFTFVVLSEIAQQPLDARVCGSDICVPLL